MVLLALVCIVFAAISAWEPRWWTLLLPFVAFLPLPWLGDMGILPGSTSLQSALLGGTIGATFAAMGLVIGRMIRSRTAAGPSRADLP